MKNEKGITLVALIIIICLLFIFSGAAIYTSVKSYEVIDIQKYKVQMQAIQSALDEFYEDFETNYELNKNELQNISINNNINDNIHITEKKDYINYYIEYITQNSTDSITNFIKEIENGTINRSLKRFYDLTSSDDRYDWWENVASDFDISIGEEEILKQYYSVSRDEIEEILGVQDIDISENFIINFENRYVFSETPIIIKDEVGTHQEVYCLYQLNEEEKVVEFKMIKTGGSLNIDIIEKNLNYQKIKIRLEGSQESKIKQVYAFSFGGLLNEEQLSITDDNEENLKIENQKEYFNDIQYENNEVTFKVIVDGSYYFIARDFFDGEYMAAWEEGTKDIVLHEPPVLEDNMIPFEAVNANTGKIFLNNGISNLNNWYDYSANKYATAVIAKSDQNGKNLNKYNKEYAGKTFTINQYNSYKEGNEGTHIVKVWIPKKLWKENNVICSSLDNTDFINRNGVWVTAKWDGNKWVPDEKKTLTATVDSFSKTQLNINCSSDISNLKYYYKIDDDATMDYTAITGNTIQITARNNLKEEVTSVSIYGIAPNGNKTTVKIVKAQKQEIDNNETGINLLNDGSFENSGSWEISCTGGNTDANLSYDTTIKRTGNSSLKLVKSKNHGEIAAKHKNNINVDYSHNYYFSAYSYQVTDTETAKTIEIFFPIVGGYSDSRSITKNIGKWQRHSWICKSRSYSSTNIGFRLDYDSPASSTTSTIYYDDAMLIDLDKLQDYINTNKINVTVSKNKEWCDTFIESKAGKTILYYYE